MGLARELAERITALNYADLPEQALYWGKVAIMDTVGVTLAGSLEEGPRILDEVLGLPASGPSLVFGTRRRASALDAALVNGMAAHALDFDNTAASLGGHVAAVMVPAMIAAGEACEGTGRDLLLAHAAGYEAGRIGYGLNPEHSERGWHPTATLGIFAVTAACARMLGLNVEQTEIALALATSLAAGTKANFGTMTKPLHAGQCARGGLLAAMLAKKGFTANPDAFEHKQGFFKLFSADGRYDTARMLEHWGKPLDSVEPGAAYKLYPCCYSTHSAVEAARTLVREHGKLDPAKVERVESRTSERALAHTNRAQPRGGLEAKFSVQYCVARALIHGEVVMDHFEGDAYKDPVAQSLLAKVHAIPYTGPFFDEAERFDADLKVTLTDGRVLHVKVDRPLGRTAGNAIPSADLEAKFRDCATRVLAPEAAEAVVRKVWALESLGSVRELTSMLESEKRESALSAEQRRSAQLAAA
ncbi:MAG: MmgE/PrpD family protein [Burkholderiales bacterium]